MESAYRTFTGNIKVQTYDSIKEKVPKMAAIRTLERNASVLEDVKRCAFLVEFISIRNCVAQLSRYLLDPFENSSNIQRVEKLFGRISSSSCFFIDLTAR